MPKHIRIQEPSERHKSPPEVKLWSAILKRALDDIAGYKPDTNEYRHAVEWLTCAGEETQVGTLSFVLSTICTCGTLPRNAIQQIQTLIFNHDKMKAYKLACIANKYMATGVNTRKTNAPSDSPKETDNKCPS